MLRRALLVLATLAFGPHAFAAKQTVCTITVNSANEREAFRAHLPADRFEVVELVERGRPDWLRAACERKVSCDVLVVSGHFAGTEFYSSRPDADESLRVDEIERAQCSDSCPGLFAGLKEVYLFGCDSLKPEAVKDHGEASRDAMRRLFAGTPLIYGFSSLAPYGRVAGPMLDRYFTAGGTQEVGRGEASARLLKLFGPSSMVATSGFARTDPRHRGLACAFLDERVPRDGKLDAIADLLGGEAAAVPRALERVERFLQTAGEATVLARDDGRRERYIETLRGVRDPALRLRMLAAARQLHWLSGDEEREETARMVAELLDSETLAHGEVDLICRLNADRALNVALPGDGPAERLARAAGRACLGNERARDRMLEAVASAVEAEVQVAQAYFRHRPIADAAELRATASRVAAMKASGAQVRALETLARFHVSDALALDELARLFARSTSLAVQRAIAEIFVRSAGAPPAAQALAELLRRHRRPSASGDDLIDTAIRRLEAS
jgi:hypothetical protein